MLCGLLLATIVPAHAQQVHRWVDEQGQVHYSDQPPPDTTKSEVIADIPRTKRDAAPAAKQPPAVTDDGSKDIYPGTPEWDAREKRRNAELETTAADSRAEFERKYDAQCTRIVTDRKAAEAAIMARCKANHETYCGSIAEIERGEMNRDMRQQSANDFARSNAQRRGEIVGAEPRRIQSVPVLSQPDPMLATCEARLKKRR